ncbi:protein adenylyltransferase SelO family protein, partial [Flavobacterium sp.]|uniref:protein adenylyltransferase SelO family protein n=1 Tax=Flavobacterium sp. TaxID=239 RepID=UPI0037BB198A
IKSEDSEKYLSFYKEVVNKTLLMIVEWQRVGFVHGVMNTDNMSILGLTIDYGPYGWLEDFDPNWTPNTTDAQGKRYRFGNQPDIALWNLVQLGNALYPLIEDIPAMQDILDQFSKDYDSQYRKMMQHKLGLENQQEEELLADLLSNLNASETDMTLFFRNLGNLEKTDTTEKALQKIENAFYKPEEIIESIRENWLKWFSFYLGKINTENPTDAERKSAMNAVNPKYVFRNYMAQLAIESAEKEDYSLIQELYLLLKNPYSEQPENEKWFAKRPDWARNKVGCSMLSCSS